MDNICKCIVNSILLIAYLNIYTLSILKTVILLLNNFGFELETMTITVSASTFLYSKSVCTARLPQTETVLEFLWKCKNYSCTTHVENGNENYVQFNNLPSVILNLTICLSPFTVLISLTFSKSSSTPMISIINISQLSLA